MAIAQLLDFDFYFEDDLTVGVKCEKRKLMKEQFRYYLYRVTKLLSGFASGNVWRRILFSNKASLI